MNATINPALGKIDVALIASILAQDVIRTDGPMDREIKNLRPMASATSESLAFCRYVDGRLRSAIVSKAAALLMQDISGVSATPGGPSLIMVANPRLAFIKVAARLFGREVEPGIHSTAIVSPTSSIDPTASIGPYVVVGPRCSIGPQTFLGPRVVLQQDVQIGANCHIDAGTVIGSEGFGFERAPTGELVNFPHLGGVRIGDNVDIGCNVCIDRGTLEDTVIERGVRIDNLTHISHNCHIGENAVVVCLVTICGSTRLGAQSWVSPNASVLNQLAVGANAYVGLGAVVVRDVGPGTVVVGNPARPLSQRKD